MKIVVGDLIDRGIYTHEEGLAYLVDRVRAWTVEREEFCTYQS